MPQSGVNYEWRVTPSKDVHLYKTSGSAQYYNSVTFGSIASTGEYVVECRITTACGSSEWI